MDKIAFFLPINITNGGMLDMFPREELLPLLKNNE